MKNLHKYLSTCLLATAALLGGASLGVAATAPNLGAAATFSVLSAAPGGGGAVTCTNSAVNGDVGSSGLLASVVQTSCTINGAIIAPVSAGVLNDFLTAYNALAPQQGEVCTTISGNLAGQVLAPGVYCVAAASTTTDGVLTLAGSSTDTWLFKIGTSGTGALTGTNFSVVMTGGGVPCNVYWWVAEAATMTTSNFVGTILAGAAITITGGTFTGDALAKAAVTMTGVYVNGCKGGSFIPPRLRCNQGVGNGPEGCDPGNSNQSNRYPNAGNPFLRSNDEPSLFTPGGVPGNPGRKGGNK